NTRFVELIRNAPTPLDITGYRLVANSVYTFPSATVGGPSPYAFLFESRTPAWFSTLGLGKDNVYLYDATGRLLDMVGWTSPHMPGMSVARSVPGAGGHTAYDDGSAVVNGWRFDQTPTPATIGLQSDQNVSADVGTVVQFPLTASNMDSTPDYLNVEATATGAWPIRFLWPNGVPLTDSSGDSDTTPDLGQSWGGVPVPFVCEVSIPIEGAIGDGDTILLTVSAAAMPLAHATVNLTIALYPHFDITRSVSPPTVYLQGSGPPYNEVAQITVSIRGAGYPTVVQLPQDVVFQIDETGSMNANDPTNLRVDAVKNYIDRMRDTDRGSLIGFTTSAWVVANRPLTATDPAGKTVLKADADTLACSPGCFGGTFINAAIQLGNDWLINFGDPTHLRVEILLTDGVCDPNPCDPTILLNQAVAEGIMIYTVGLGTNTNPAFLQNIADRTGGKYFQANTPQDLAAIYAEIGTRVNRTAGVALPNDVTPMIEDDAAPYLTVLPGTFLDPFTGAPRDPTFMQQRGDRTLLQWNVSKIQINETWAVSYSVTSTRLGPQDVALYPDSRVAYQRWDDSTVYQTIPQSSLTVLAAPTPPFITATNPADGAASVPVDQSIQAVFSEAMDAPTVAWLITPSVPLTPSWLSPQILLLSHPDFAECTQYTVAVTAGRDTEGEALVSGPVPNPWSFTTLCTVFVNYTITRSPARANVRVDGTDYPAPTTFQWRPGDSHDLSAVDFDPQGPSRWAFLSWDDGGARNHSVSVGAIDLTITALYALQHPAQLTLVGLDPGRPVHVGWRLFGAASASPESSAWASWVDDGSALNVDGILAIGTAERYITRDTVAWTVNGPLARTVQYYHQFTATVRLLGLGTHDVHLDATSFGMSDGAGTHATWSDWVDAQTSVSVDALLSIGERERYGTPNPTQWRADAPLDETVSYIHQFLPRITLVGLDTNHAVGASWHADGKGKGRGGLSDSLEEWSDAGTFLTFDRESSGTPRLLAQDPTSFTVDSAFDATIRYAAFVPPNWKPLLALVYSILLIIAGAVFGTRALDRYVPPPAGGDVRARRFAWRNLTLGEKFNELSVPQIEEKVHRDRRFTRLLLILPFAATEGAIGLLSMFTGILRIPDAGSWIPLGFWINTALLVAGLGAGLAVRRTGYRMNQTILLRLAGARDKAGATPVAGGGPGNIPANPSGKPISRPRM
ncbi:MAG: VWA domain-containing protein, partial [Methanobacteriota archaeon]